MLTGEPETFIGPPEGLAVGVVLSTVVGDNTGEVGRSVSLGFCCKEGVCEIGCDTIGTREGCNVASGTVGCKDGPTDGCIVGSRAG